MDFSDTESKPCGFQKPNKYLKYLPYAIGIDAEAEHNLKTVVEKLTKAVLLQDIKHGARFWTKQLHRFIKLYGLWMTKQDHIMICKLLFEIIVTPEQEVSLLRPFVACFNRLLKKKELLSPDELVFPWRPVLNLWKSICDSKAVSYGQKFYPPYSESTVQGFIKTCRCYFPPEATREILEEGKPLQCPFDMTMVDIFELYDLFLPTSGLPRHHNQMFKLWFDEFWGIYEALDGNGVGWEAKLVRLLARLAGHNIGLIDWEPALPVMFSRVLRAFGLPVGPAKYQQAYSDPGYECTSSCLLIVASITPTNSAMRHIGQLARTVEPFMHPSNYGAWQKSLQTFFCKLCSMFVTRLRTERYKSASWDNYIPSEQKLTDAQVTEFVEIMKPAVFTGLFSKFGSQDMATSLFYLAFLRPERVIPDHLNNLYPALENLTEPHRLQATLAGTLAVARAMVSSTRWYPDGRLHVIPIMHLCLPGIDSNDSRKTMSTLQLITTFATLMPIVDCSDAHLYRDDLTELEKELCSQSAQLLDLVFIYLDRLFALIEGLSLDHHESAAAIERASAMEAFIEVVVRTATITVFQQMSTDILKLAFDKVWQYLSESVFEVVVAGRLAASVMSGVMRPSPLHAMSIVVPHCCAKIIEYTANSDMIKEERQDNALLWNLLLLSECVRMDGAVAVLFADRIEAVLDRALHMTDKTAHEFAGHILQRFLKSLCSTYPLNHCSVQQSFDTPLAEYLPIRDWAKSCDLNTFRVDWHVPSQQELEVVQRLFCKYMKQELEFLNDNPQCEREPLERSLRNITECLRGCGLYIPPLEAQAVPLNVETISDMNQPTCKARPDDFILSLDGENARNRILSAMQPIMKRLLEQDKDSAKPLVLLTGIYKLLLIYFGAEEELVKSRGKSIKQMSKALENPLLGAKSQLRMIQVERVFRLQEMRVQNHVHIEPFNKHHLSAYQDLLVLATSRYDDVQSQARLVLGRCFTLYAYSVKTLVPAICDLLQTPPPAVTEEMFKGALNLVFNSESQRPSDSLAVRREMTILQQIWPAVICAQHSEKPAIQSLVDRIIKKVELYYETPNWSFPTSEGSKQAALVLRQSAGLNCDLDLEAGSRAAQAWGHQLRESYNSLLRELLDLIHSDSLQWKHREYAMEMVAFMQRIDRRPSFEEMQLFTDNLVHDSASVRKLCMGSLTGMMYNLKRPQERTVISRSQFSGYQSLQYCPDDLPDSQEKWDHTVFVEKTHWGCVHWPSYLTTYRGVAPPVPEELDSVEVYLLNAFRSSAFLEKFFKYLALENKDKERFLSRHYNFFKCLARNYGPAILEPCKIEVERLQEETNHQTQTSRQRCVAECITGLLRGAKYWSFSQMNNLYDWALPVIGRAIRNVSTEAMDHWGTAIATCSENRDPRKLYRLFQFLMSEVDAVGHDGDTATSLETTSRLYFLQGALGQQEWRVPRLNAHLVSVIEQRLASPFKSVRSRIGSVLCSTYVYDIPYFNEECWNNPKRSELLSRLLPALKCLEDEVEEDGVDTSRVVPMETLVESSPDSKVKALERRNGTVISNGLREEKSCRLMFKTILSWLISNFERHIMYQRWTPEIMQLLPMICPQTADFSDPEMRSLCTDTIKNMTKCLIPATLTADLLRAIEESVALPSWHARTTILEILQMSLFLNQFLLQDHKIALQNIIVRLLSDERFEVKLVAATTLSGAIQCQFFDAEHSGLIKHFRGLVNTSLREKNSATFSKRLSSCLTGVLGLGAIVRAYPYEVPEFLPEILMVLSDHAHDPPPVQKSVKDVLSEFKRTHHDNWVDHKEKFTDDQLAVLTDLLVSPNYYA